MNNQLNFIKIWKELVPIRVSKKQLEYYISNVSRAFTVTN
jgi:hypothetical protein